MAPSFSNHWLKKWMAPNAAATLTSQRRLTRAAPRPATISASAQTTLNSQSGTTVLTNKARTSSPLIPRGKNSGLKAWAMQIARRRGRPPDNGASLSGNVMFSGVANARCAGKSRAKRLASRSR